MIKIRDIESIIMNYSHIKIEFVFNRERKFNSPNKEISYNFDYKFIFRKFKGLFVIYCDSNDYSIKPRDVEEVEKAYKFLIPLYRKIDTNLFLVNDQFTFRPATGSVNLYLIPFSNLIEQFFPLDLEVEQFEFSKASITIHPFPNNPDPMSSKRINYDLRPSRDPFNKTINSRDFSLDFVVNQFNQLPILLGAQERLPKERAIITKTKIKEIQGKLIVAKEAFEDLFEKLADIFSSITDLGTNIDELREENIEHHEENIEHQEKTRELVEQGIKKIIENQNVSDLINYLITEKVSVEKIRKRIKENFENLPKEKIEAFFKPLKKALEKYGDISMILAKTRKEKVIQGFRKVVSLLGGEIAGWGAEKLLNEIIDCF